MLTDDPVYRPVGAAEPKRRLLSLRHVLMALGVLLVGGGGGTAAFFLSDMDLRDMIGFLDIADPGGPKLTMLMPGLEGQGAAVPAVASVPVAKDLLTPPGGQPVKPEPVPLALAAPPPPAEHAAVDDHGHELPAHDAPAKPAFDAKLFAGIVVPPPAGSPVANTVPPPAPHVVDHIPSLADLPPVKAGEALSPAPDKALLGNSPRGPLPVVAADGRQPWKVYARPSIAPKSQPRMAVVVTQLGLDMMVTEQVIAHLPADVTLAFSPYALELGRWLKMARDTGHETLIMLPVTEDDPGAPDQGPLALAHDNSDKENLIRLEMILNRAPGVVGVLVPNETYWSHAKDSPIMGALLRRGLLYVGQPNTGMHNPAMAIVNDLVDKSPWKTAIDTRLALAARNVVADHTQVLVASPRPVTMNTLVPWLDTLDQQGIALIPVSALGTPPTLEPEHEKKVSDHGKK